MVDHLREADLVEFEVGYDRFAAQAIAAECEARGRRVELLTMDNAGQSPGLLALQPHRIIAEAADADAVGEIVDRWTSDHAPDDQPFPGRRRPVAWVAAATLLTVIVLSLGASLLDVF